MASIKTVSFRIPSKYIVFLEAVAQERSTKAKKVSRTDVLLGILDSALNIYLYRSQAKS